VHASHIQSSWKGWNFGCNCLAWGSGAQDLAFTYFGRKTAQLKAKNWLAEFFFASDLTLISKIVLVLQRGIWGRAM